MIDGRGQAQRWLRPPRSSVESSSIVVCGECQEMVATRAIDKTWKACTLYDEQGLPAPMRSLHGGRPHKATQTGLSGTRVSLYRSPASYNTKDASRSAGSGQDEVPAGRGRSRLEVHGPNSLPYTYRFRIRARPLQLQLLQCRCSMAPARFTACPAMSLASASCCFNSGSESHPPR